MKKFVKDKVTEFTLEPKPQTWDNIEEALNGKKKRVAVWWFVLPLVFILGVASNLLVNKINSNTETEKTETENPALKKENTTSTQKQETLIKDQELTKQENKNIGLSQKTNKGIQYKETSPIKMVENNYSNNKATNNVKQSTQKKETISQISNLNLNPNATIRDKKGTKTFVLNNENGKVINMDSLRKMVKTITKESEKEIEEKKVTKDTVLLTQNKVDAIKANKTKKINDVTKLNWNIGLYAGMGMTNNYRTLQKNNISKQFGNNSLNNDERVKEKSLTGTSYGISIDRGIRDRLNLGLSIGLSQYSWKTFTGDSIPNSIATFPSNTLNAKMELYEQKGNLEYKNMLKTYSVQAQIGKTVIKKNRLSLSTTLGIGYERVSHSSILYYSHYNNIYASSNENTSNYHKGFATASISLPLEYKSKGNFSYWLSPSLKTSINSYLNSDFETQRPYFYGILGGIKYHL